MTKQTIEKTLEFYNSDGVGTQAHHIFPQKFIEYFAEHNINIHESQFIELVDTSIHQNYSYMYNKFWEQFIEDNPNASYNFILLAGQFAMGMMR